MPKQRRLEQAVGLFVGLGFAAFFVLALKASDVTSIGHDKGYRITARFQNVGGLKVRAPVTLGGVRIGRVVEITLDPQRFEAITTLSIDPRYDHLPEDSSASILTAGLLGEQYIGLEAGGMDRYLQNGSTLQITQSALVLEKLIGHLLTNAISGETPPPKSP